MLDLCMMGDYEYECQRCTIMMNSEERIGKVGGSVKRCPTLDGPRAVVSCEGGWKHSLAGRPQDAQDCPKSRKMRDDRRGNQH